MKKWKNREKGITLIALVITIIVLLILAGVTIATLTGDNGLLQKATVAKQSNEEATALEKIKVEVAGSYGLDGKIEVEQLNKNLKRISGLSYKDNEIDLTDDTKKINTLPATVKLNGYTYTILEDGNIEKSIWLQDKTTVVNAETGKQYDVGDIVKYNWGVSGYYGKWGILGVENGKLLLMSTVNVGNVGLSGKEDYMTEKLSNVCNVYKNETYADLARSIKIEDIDRVVGYNKKTAKSYEFTMENGKVKRNDQEVPSGISKFEHVDGRKLPDNSPIQVFHTIYGYSISSTLISGSKAYNLLKDDNFYYWLDSPFENVGLDNVYWGYTIVMNNGINNDRLWSSYNGAGNAGHGVRAVVYLKSNVQITGDSTSGFTLQV